MPENPEGTIRIKVFATLRKFVRAESDYPASGPVIIGDIIAALGIPPKKVTVIFLNGRHAEHGDTASPGDKVSLFPPVGGG